MTMNSPPPIPRTSDWDVPAIRIAVLALWLANTAFWIYSFRFLFVRSNPMGDGFDMLPAVPFTVIFFCLTLPAGIKAVRGYAGLGSALMRSLAAAALNAMIFMAVASTGS
jgi:hypothetical protein